MSLTKLISTLRESKTWFAILHRVQPRLPAEIIHMILSFHTIELLYRPDFPYPLNSLNRGTLRYLYNHPRFVRESGYWDTFFDSRLTQEEENKFTNLFHPIPQGLQDTFPNQGLRQDLYTTHTFQTKPPEEEVYVMKYSWHSVPTIRIASKQYGNEIQIRKNNMEHLFPGLYYDCECHDYCHVKETKEEQQLFDSVLCDPQKGLVCPCGFAQVDWPRKQVLREAYEGDQSTVSVLDKASCELLPLCTLCRAIFDRVVKEECDIKLRHPYEYLYWRAECKYSRNSSFHPLDYLTLTYIDEQKQPSHIHSMLPIRIYSSPSTFVRYLLHDLYYQASTVKLSVQFLSEEKVDDLREKGYIRMHPPYNVKKTLPLHVFGNWLEERKIDEQCFGIGRDCMTEYQSPREDLENGYGIYDYATSSEFVGSYADRFDYDCKTDKFFYKLPVEKRLDVYPVDHVPARPLYFTKWNIIQYLHPNVYSACSSSSSGTVMFIFDSTRKIIAKFQFLNLSRTLYAIHKDTVFVQTIQEEIETQDCEGIVEKNMYVDLPSKDYTFIWLKMLEDEHLWQISETGCEECAHPRFVIGREQTKLEGYIRCIVDHFEDHLAYYDLPTVVPSPSQMDETSKGHS